MASGSLLPGSGKLSGNCRLINPEGWPRWCSHSQEPDGPSNRRLAADSGSGAAQRPVSVTQQTSALNPPFHPVASRNGFRWEAIHSPSRNRCAGFDGR